ncbi:hypothetical protein EZMO1_3456 [Endozoicomonas montiporae CL-33]|uniref:Uncharacterized protein n=1 Tax=Endozoicomonas montiporae CL-33 TaxID=570277 RepID=A0A142BFB9_9GAMM|nr:hypothetical protein EZMO1_3456 [Endozoicomonas montiporae CL-33]
MFVGFRTGTTYTSVHKKNKPAFLSFLKYRRFEKSDLTEVIKAVVFLLALVICQSSEAIQLFTKEDLVNHGLVFNDGTLTETGSLMVLSHVVEEVNWQLIPHFQLQPVITRDSAA